MYKAVGDSVVVKQIVEERKSSGGILLTGVACSTPHDTIIVEVVSVGSQVNSVAVGEKVIIQKHSTVPISEAEVGNDKVLYMAIKEREVLGVVDS